MENLPFLRANPSHRQRTGRKAALVPAAARDAGAFRLALSPPFA